MVVALLPESAKKSSLPVAPSKVEKLVAEALIEGMPLAKLANKLAKRTGKTPRYWRHRVRRLAGTSAYVRDQVFAASKGDALMGLGSAVEGMNRRAARGRIDAVKLNMAVTGFHSDKVSHEHSGNIEISVSIPRPQTTVDQLGPGKDSESFVDADVVEED